MKFMIHVSPETATTVVEALVHAARNAGQQWDVVSFFRQVPVEKDARPDEVVYKHTHDRPAGDDFAHIVGYAAGSRVTLTKETWGSNLLFEGSRGSLTQHWRIAEILRDDGGEVEGYETSLPGMLPWEGLWTWFSRVAGVGAYCPFCPMNEYSEWRAFNDALYASLKELSSWGGLSSPNQLIRARDAALEKTKERFSIQTLDEDEEGDFLPSQSGRGKSERFAPTY